MLASIEKEKASSCKHSWTSEHLFRSHLQVHVTWRLCGKCLTCAALASIYAWGVLLQMSEAEGPKLFQHSTQLEMAQASYSFFVLEKRFPDLVHDLLNDSKSGAPC